MLVRKRKELNEPNHFHELTGSAKDKRRRIAQYALLGRRNRWEKVSDIQCLYPVHGETIKLSPAMRGNLGAL